jgi:hypothetical protein
VGIRSGASPSQSYEVEIHNYALHRRGGVLSWFARCPTGIIPGHNHAAAVGIEQNLGGVKAHPAARIVLAMLSGRPYAAFPKAHIFSQSRYVVRPLLYPRTAHHPSRLCPLRKTNDSPSVLNPDVGQRCSCHASRESGPSCRNISNAQLPHVCRRSTRTFWLYDG